MKEPCHDFPSGVVGKRVKEAFAKVGLICEGTFLDRSGFPMLSRRFGLLREPERGRLKTRRVTSRSRRECLPLIDAIYAAQLYPRGSERDFNKNRRPPLQPSAVGERRKETTERNDAGIQVIPIKRARFWGALKPVPAQGLVY